MNTEDPESPQNEEDLQKEDSKVKNPLKESPQEEDTIEEDIIVEDSVEEELPVEDTMVEDSVEEELPVEDTIVEDSVEEELPVEDTIMEDSAEEESPEDDTLVEESLEEETLVDESIQEVSQKENTDSSAIETPISESSDGEMVPMTESDVKNELLDFSELDLDNFTDQDLLDMEEAISENMLDEEDFVEGEMGAIAEEPEPEFQPDIDEDLEAKMQAEIQKKKKEQGIKTVTKETFIQNLSNRRNKIIYHALWHLVFNIEDHEATKQTLYEALKGVTSKNPVEPLDEHKFYFGLGFILRMQLYDEKVVQFKQGKLKIMVNCDHLQELLNMVGDPISDLLKNTTTRNLTTPKMEKKNMFSDFLNDDFLDI